MATLEVEKLTIDERLNLIDLLWSSLHDEKKNVKSPDWHKKVLGQRRKKIEDGNTDFIDLEELRKS